jgi:hypothetical protein
MLWAVMLDNPELFCYNDDSTIPLRSEYMIELTIQRMERVEAVLEAARSEWAQQHWNYVLQHLRRQLVKYGSTV